MSRGKLEIGKKNYKIQDLIILANQFIRQGTNSIAERELIQSFVSQILLDTENYNGFNYLQDPTAEDFDKSRIFFYGPYHKKATK